MWKKIWPDIKWLFNYMTSILMYAIIVVLVLVGIILLAYFIDVTKRGRSTDWQPPLYGAYIIVSGSMEPIIKVNDAIVIKRTERKINTGTRRVSDTSRNTPSRL